MRLRLMQALAWGLGVADKFLFHFENAIFKVLFVVMLSLISLNLFLVGNIVVSGKNIDKFREALVYAFVPNYENGVDFSGSVLGFSVVRSGLTKISDPPALPNISAKSYVVADAASNKILESKNEHMKLPPASTTKLVTALVAEELYESSSSLKMTADCSNLDTQSAGLFVNETYTYKDLLSSMIVFSAGDSACLLSRDKISYSDFISRMNSKVSELGLTDTNFVNPIGLDGADGSQHSTAYDLYIIARAAKASSTLSQLFSTKEYSFFPASGEGFKYSFTNTNRLLFEIEGTVGLKTGKTQNAGEVLVYEYKKDSIDLIIVVMGSNDRFSDTKKLLDWTISSYK